jgi:hypothetical protein
MIAIPSKPTTARQAATLADLKLIHGVSGQHAVLAGYYAAGDGGGGPCWWDAASTATPDDGLTFQVTGVPVGRWRRIWAGPLDVRAFGVIADGATNRHVRLQAALDSGVHHLRGHDNGLALRQGATLVIRSNTWLDLDPGYTLQLDPALPKGVVHIKNTTYFGTDHDIRITGGIWDSSNLPVDYLNAIGQSTSRIASGESGGLGARISLAGVTRARVEDATFVNSSSLGPSAIQIASCNDVKLLRNRLNALAGDGLHLNGPIDGLEIDGLTGSTGDDGIALQAWDWLYGSPNHGEIRNVTIRNVRLTGCGNFLKMTASGDAPIRNFKMENCSVDDPSATVVLMFMDADAYDPSHVVSRGTLENITFGNVTATRFGGTFFHIEHNVKGLRIRNCPLDAALSGARGCYLAPGVTIDDVEWGGLKTAVTSAIEQVIWTNGATVKHMRFDGGRFDGRNTVTYSSLVTLTNSGTNAGTIDHLVTDGMTIDAPLGRVFDFAVGTTVNDLGLNNVTATQTASGNPAFIESAGTLKRLKLSNGRYAGGQCFLRSTNTSAPVAVTGNGVTFDGQTHVYLNAGVAASLGFTGCIFDNLPGGVVTNYDFADGDSSTATNDVQTNNCTLTAASIGLGGAAFKNPGGGTCRWRGIDIAQDLTLLTPTKWDTANSLVAAEGPMIRGASATWEKWGHA